jgi:hypothetical protein
MCTGLEPLLFGTAATAGAAATTGLIGAAGAMTAGGAFTLASTGFQMMSSMNKGSQQQDMANYQAAQANADAQSLREVSQVNAEKIRRAGKTQQSAARSALAASGVMTDAGTPLMIQGQIEQNSESDALTELLTGVRGGKKLDAEASGLRVAGSNAKAQGYAGAAGSLLAMGGSMGSKYGELKKPTDRLF